MRRSHRKVDYLRDETVEKIAVMRNDKNSARIIREIAL